MENIKNLLFVCLCVCVCVCLSVRFGCIFSETAERIWLKFCTEMEVHLHEEDCELFVRIRIHPTHCIFHFGGDHPRGPVIMIASP